MAKQKYYAVRKGKSVGVFLTWEECQNMTTGYPGAEFKSFSTKREAEAFVRGEEPVAATEETEPKKKSGRGADDADEAWTKLPEDHLLAYVDGSYEDSIKKYAFGCAFLTPKGNLIRVNGSGSNPESAAIRNVAGEMLGAMYAVRFATKNGYRHIEIRYDYAGIEHWVTGAWKANNPLTRKYAEYMNRAAITIKFTKVMAHTNNKYNDIVDGLAKEALTKEDGIPEVLLEEEYNSEKL